MRIETLLAAGLMFALSSSLLAHDTWVQTNTNVIRTGDAVHVDLMLGNHGNEHRDFKLASKIGLEGVRLSVVDPKGRKYDLLDRLNDTGYTPKEGFWSGKFAATALGMHVVEHSLDRVVNHGKPVRSIRSSKTFFVVSKSLDRIPLVNPGFEKPFGHALELVPTTNPVTPMGPGETLGVQLILHGKPLEGARVSFIPRGEALATGFDPKYERTTDAEGKAEFIPTTGNYYLVVAHHRAEDQAGDGFEATHYTATMVVFVPELCPCCDE